MSDQTVTVIAALKIKEEFKDDFLKVCETLVPKSREEAGCVVYNFHQEVKDPCSVMFYEIWKSQKDLEDHQKTAHFDEFKVVLDKALASGPDVTEWVLK